MLKINTIYATLSHFLLKKNNLFLLVNFTEKYNEYIHYYFSNKNILVLFIIINADTLLISDSGI